METNNQNKAIDKNRIAIKVTASTGSAISERSKIIEVDKTAAQEEIEEAALSAFWEMASFSYEEIEILDK